MKNLDTREVAEGFKLSDILENLCFEDTRNPKAYTHMPDSKSENIDDCLCKNCREGKTKLALAMLKMMDEIETESKLRDQLEHWIEVEQEKVEEIEIELREWKSNTCNDLLKIKNKEIEDLNVKYDDLNLKAIHHELSADDLQAENDELKKQVEGMQNCVNCKYTKQCYNNGIATMCVEHLDRWELKQ
ncbi:hypothetical protein KAR91_53495 [Candidatus Pacearchaeota archaeon]|nr:hypothetical protein [Candidatus Pacearchaeota archaeon]